MLPWESVLRQLRRESNGLEHYWQECEILQPYFRTGCWYKLEWKCTCFISFLSLQRSDPCFDVDFCKNVNYAVDPFSFALHFLAPHINWNPISALPSTPGKMQSGERRPMIKFATWAPADCWKLLTWSANYIDPMQRRLWRAISASLCDSMWKALMRWQVNNKVHSRSQTNPVLRLNPHYWSQAAIHVVMSFHKTCSLYTHTFSRY